MNNLQVFFQTRIVNPGPVHDSNHPFSTKYMYNFYYNLGSYLLMPLQMLFVPSKKISLKKDNSIAKVTQFEGNVFANFKKSKTSKQDPKLTSLHLGGLDMAGPLVFAFLFVVSIPLTLLGVIFKGISYASPEIRLQHNLVKEKLTPKDYEIGNKDYNIDDQSTLVRLSLELLNHIKSGQKTGTLVISGNGTLDKFCLELIRDINPKKLVLNGVTIDTLDPSLNDMPNKMRPSIARIEIKEMLENGYNVRYLYEYRGNSYKWDTKALELDEKEQAPKTVVASVKEALAYKHTSGFFNHRPKHVLLIVDESKVNEVQNSGPKAK